MPEPPEPTVSVVVPVFNGGTNIRATIEHILRQSLTPLEIIVVDDGSTDHTAEVLRSFGSRITVYSKPNGGPASARNVGIRASIGTLVAFTDSDCLPSENWLEEIVKGFRSPKIAGVGGTVCGASTGLVSEYIDLHRWMNPHCGEGGVVLNLITANACFRSDVLLRADLFDERFCGAGGEDTEISVRLRGLGYEFAFVESAVVRHRHKRTIRGYFKNIANHGEGQFVLERLWPEQKWARDHGKKMVSSAAGFGSMCRFYRSYRKQHDPKKAFVFSLLDHCQYLARIWGYRRGKRRLSNLSFRNPLNQDSRGVLCSSESGEGEEVLLRRAYTARQQ